MRPFKLLSPPNFIVRGAVIALLGLFMVLAFRSCDKRHNQEQANLVNQGATLERVQQQSETINAVQNAQKAVEHPTPEQLNIVCDKYDRNCPHHP